MPPTQYMQVQMADRLASIVTGIDHNPVATIERLFPCDARRSPQQMPKQRRMFHLSMSSRSNMLFRNHQQMHRSLGVDVRKGEAQVILVHPLRWNDAGDDLAEEA